MVGGPARPIVRDGVSALVGRLLVEEDGQDILEYALLTGAIGLAGLAVMNAMGVSLGTAYASWNAAIDGLWEPDEAAPKG